ncbi:MAG: peptidase C11 [Firmicutes bacterium]|nr:peptidase C11 [Bacillota bacterium]
MIYMCGTDLESKASMGTSDLKEMQSASLSDNVNLIIYTGGCSGWRNNLVSSKVNQVYQIKNGKFLTLVDDAGSPAMTDPNTLSSFIKWTDQNFPADRRILILWDHGGGSISGYGYDEKNPTKGSMTLPQIDQALEDAGVTFDFVGFDACLMATAETALVVSDYADYMVASEEVEPGIGWFYTNWLNDLADNTSTDTVVLGKRICDDFAAKCRTQCPGQETTLSVVDLAELSQTLPSKLKAFAKTTNSLIEGDDFQTVASARSGSREFSPQNRIDQIDLVHFASRLGTKEGKDLADTILSAVKYNKTSSNSAHAYGLSIYFPYKKLASVDSISSIYNKIGIAKEYTSCIKHFAQLQTSGYSTGYGSSSPLSSLFEELYGAGSSGTWGTGGSSWGGSSTSGGSWGGSSGGSISEDLATQLIQGLLTGQFRDFSSVGLEELNEENTRFLTDEPLDTQVVVRAATKARLEAADLAWQQDSSGQTVIKMSEAKWDQVQTVDKAVYYNDGSGFLELGFDNVYDFNDKGDLIPDADDTWISLDGHPVAYYHLSTIDYADGSYYIDGYVPVILNGQRAQLILVFDSANEDGYVAGVRYDYTEGETDTQAKTLTALEAGDQVTFVCDYYDYEGQYSGSYTISQTFQVSDPSAIQVSNTHVGNGVNILYRFTDIYGRAYWTSVLQ